jgi:hypothetical protein
MLVAALPGLVLLTLILALVVWMLDRFGLSRLGWGKVRSRLIAMIVVAMIMPTAMVLLYHADLPATGLAGNWLFGVAVCLALLGLVNIPYFLKIRRAKNADRTNSIDVFS